MKLPQLNKLLNRWPYKLACLALAIVVYMLHRSMEMEKKTFIIPIQIEQSGSVMSIDTIINNVTITVRSDPDTISTIHPSDFKASVSLNSLSVSGEYQLPVDVIVKNDLYNMATFELQQKPQNIKVRVEKKEVAYIPLEPTIVGIPAYGYEVSETIVEPKFIEVIGPDSILKNTTRIQTEKIDVSEKKSTFTFSVGYKNPNSVIQIQDKGPFSVKIIMDSIKIDRAFEQIAVEFRGLKKELAVTGEYPPITVTLNGAMVSLEDYIFPEKCLWVDLSSIEESGTYELPVQCSVPSYYKVTALSNQTLFVTVDVAKVEELLVQETDLVESRAE